MPSAQMNSFEAANPHVPFLVPSADGYAEKRETRGQSGQELKPLGIAMPRDAKQVSDIVRWAIDSGTEFTVRTGGNDFFGRNAADGALIIDMRDINDVSVAADKSTATFGGGVVGKDLITKFEAEDVVAPLGNIWSVGYVGWATLGGYGPLTNLFGLGLEGIVGAEIVNSKGDIVEASDEIVEGIRGMGGNLGIITSLTIKVYPARKLLSGMIIMPATPDNIKETMAAEAKLGIPNCLTVHHFITQMQGRVLVIFFTWSDPDLEKGQQFVESFVAALPPVMMNTVKEKTLFTHYAEMPNMCLPWGGQRSLTIKELSTNIFDILMEAMDVMPPGVNITWTDVIEANEVTGPKNCHGSGRHILLSFSDMVAEENQLAPARAWNNALYNKLRASGDDAILEPSYPALTRPEDKTPQQLFGKKWSRVTELKEKHDPNNVFKYAVPRM